MNVIVTPATIQVPNTNRSLSITGLWDTGASGSAITKRVVQALGLIPTGRTDVQTAGGTFTQNQYTINISLPNGVLIEGITATELDGVVGSDSDALIGMDVIGIGDFSITNYNGKTCFSFRAPSMHEIDYVKDQNLMIGPKKQPLIRPSLANPSKKKKR